MTQTNKQNLDCNFDCWMEKLQQKGFRITRPLQIITDILLKSDFILNPTEVYLQAKEQYPRIGLVTVYRTIEKLEHAGLINRVHMPDGCQSFFQTCSGHQHLLICQQCGKAEYFEGENLNIFFHSIGEQFGYKIIDHWLQIFGLCEKCRLKETKK